MVCPYCSADMEPIELNGKVFCSNCGLTIANNGQTQPPVEETEVVSNVETNDIQDTVSLVDGSVSEKPEDKDTWKISQLTDEDETSEIESRIENLEAENNEIPTPSEPRKLEVVTEESPVAEAIPAPPEVLNPITEETARDFGITPAEPVLESKIPDISIPSEEDFASAAPAANEPAESYIELANPGNEKSALEASGILLDILGEEKPKEEKSMPEPKSNAFLPPVRETIPEIPEKTETKEEDDIYIVPKEIRKGIRKKKAKKNHEKTETPLPVIPSERTEPRNPLGGITEGSLSSSLSDEAHLRVDDQQGRDDNAPVDPKTEKKIEKLEEKIAETPEPIVDLTPKEAEKYDPDTIEKSAVIKEYFSTALEKDKTSHKEKAKKIERKGIWKTLGLFVLGLIMIAGFAVGGYFLYKYLKPTANVQQTQEAAKFTTLTPSYVPEGYALSTSSYVNSSVTFEMKYIFAADETKTIAYKQVKTDDPTKYIADYLKNKNATYVTKDVNGITFTELDKVNLAWQKDGFAFIIETANYTLANDLLYQMAEGVK